MPAAKQIFGRRSYSPATGERVTFISCDRADNDPWGWECGWFNDGDVVRGHTIVHVAEPSWRVTAPVMTAHAEAA